MTCLVSGSGRTTARMGGVWIVMVRTRHNRWQHNDVSAAQSPVSYGAARDAGGAGS